MKSGAAVVATLLILGFFVVAIGPTENPMSNGTPPHLDGSKTSSPSVIYAEGKGSPDKAEVNITIWGAGDPLVNVFPQDVVFVIDSSGSMGPGPGGSGNDPTGQRKVAAKYYVDQLKIEYHERAAVVDFDDTAQLVGNDHLSTNYPLIKSNIDTIDDLGGTDIPAAMAVANNELIGYGWSNHTWIIILLTDGQNWCLPGGSPCPPLDHQMDDPGDPLIQQAINNGITYYTVGLGSGVNPTLLSNLANFTGGTYHPAASASELQQIYDDIHQEIVSMAGKDVTVGETLTLEFEYVNNSFSIAPSSQSGKNAEWEIPSLSINESWSVSFEVRSSTCGDNMQIDEDTNVTYTSPTNASDYLMLPPVYVDVIGCNVPPVANAGGVYISPENSIIYLNASGSYDPDGNITSYEWDLDNDGMYDDATGMYVNYTWNDDFEGVVGLKVTDDYGDSATSIANVTISNVDPSVSILYTEMSCAIGLRVAGSKWSNVNLTLYEEGIEIGWVEVERWPGSPSNNPSVGSIPTVLDLNLSYEAVVQYDPYPDDGDEIEGDQGNNGKDKQNNAGNPVWLTLDCGNESKWIHHTFNTQQSKKRGSDHENHVEPWYVDIKPELVGMSFTMVGVTNDPGSDDVTFTWTYGSQIVVHTFLNGASPDPYYSPYTGTAPVGLSHTVSLVYEGPGTVTLTISDDDEGMPTDTPGSNSASVTIG